MSGKHHKTPVENNKVLSRFLSNSKSTPFDKELDSNIKLKKRLIENNDFDKLDLDKEI